MIISTEKRRFSALRNTKRNYNMSYTTDIKKEIIHRLRGELFSLESKKACLSAFIRTSGALGVQTGNPAFFVVSETESVAEFFTQLFFEVFQTELSVTHASKDRKSGRDKLVLQCPPKFSAEALFSLKLLKNDKKNIRNGICKRLVKTEDHIIAYVQGAFLGSGSCILPKTGGSGYHLEIVFEDGATARDFCALLAEIELMAKVVKRKETYVVYIKSKEGISDFLSVVGAENALKKFALFLEKRDEANRENRAKNCISGNADKTAIASVKQVLALEKIQEKIGLNQLSEELAILAKARLKHPEKSLRELAEILTISKSCINHRMRKLMEMAEEL